ncbi:helix-turn-helix domain-containing protein [Micromonospora violae]|uniref:helix-turn-helix domain-containing protein n=1 Tax=Micromonospora violae TaxID=1278207 RepID=UPI0033E2D961
MRDLSQRQLAALAEVDQAAVARFERGPITPPATPRRDRARVELCLRVARRAVGRARVDRAGGRHTKTLNVIDNTGPVARLRVGWVALRGAQP